MKQLRAILIGAGSRGARAYGPYAIAHPEAIRFVAVAEPDEERRKSFCRAHGIAPDMAFTDFPPLLESGIEADVVFICTQDALHKRPALMALDAGYDVVLEKPIADSLADSEEVVARAAEKRQALFICHVLRYTGFFGKLKQMIEDGEIGDLVHIRLTENVGYWHTAHSFVRGNWRNEALSNPMILAKCCHDMDMLYWLAGSPCTQVSSFGSLRFFTQANAPQGHAARCLDGCKAKADCAFDAEKIYMDPDQTGWPVNVISEDLSPEGRHRALKNGPYGRCVFACDNDVVDRQVVNLAFESGALASFDMNPISAQTGRDINVYGTAGQIWGKLEDNMLYKQLFGGEPQAIPTRRPGDSEYGHGGGDDGLMDYVCAMLSNPDRSAIPAQSDAIYSHRICFAAEKSRKEQVVVSLP